MVDIGRLNVWTEEASIESASFYYMDVTSQDGWENVILRFSKRIYYVNEGPTHIVATEIRKFNSNLFPGLLIGSATSTTEWSRRPDFEAVVSYVVQNTPNLQDISKNIIKPISNLLSGDGVVLH